jgi:hypothetical protein
VKIFKTGNYKSVIKEIFCGLKYLKYILELSGGSELENVYKIK